MVFKCPTSIKKGKEYVNVSKRNCSFKDKNITHGLLNTLLSEMRRSLVAIGTYIPISNDEKVEKRYRDLQKKILLNDPNYEMIIYKERNDMSKTDAIYYYIRNSFAHGDFEIITVNDNRIYKLESEKNNEIKAWIRLKEKTLLRYIELCNLSPHQIVELRKRK